MQMKLPEESKVERCWATADELFKYTHTNIFEDEPHNYKPAQWLKKTENGVGT
jgi:hypothetical protein